MSDHDSQSFERTMAVIARILTTLVYWYLAIVEMLLGLGFFLLLFGANPNNNFVGWVYRNLDRAMEPFRGIFTPLNLGDPAVASVSAVFDGSVLFAMVVYGIVAMLFNAVIHWLSRRIRAIDIREQLDQQHEAYQAANVPTTPPDVVGDLSKEQQS